MTLTETPILESDAAQRIRRLRIAMVVGIVALFFVGVPILNSAGVTADYQVNFLGKYLCFAIVAVGIDLIWGYTGLLSLSQALFFCMGGYMMAMHLSLPQGGGDVRPEYHNIPQFMFFNNVHELPAFWKPFQSLAFTLVAGVALPALVAGLFGFFILRSRVRGVYFSIITQAVAWGAWLLISRNEMLLGGTNGLTNFSKALTEKRSWIVGFYLTTLVALVLVYLACLWITRSRLGRVLVAVRDRESRLYFAGYKPYVFKVFAFAVAAAIAAVGGMLYSPQVTIISPHNMRVEESILMVIWVAVGGRGRLWGAILGTLLVNYTYTTLTSDLPKVWPFIQGAMFLGVVLLFPDGLVGLWDRVEQLVGSRASALSVGSAALPLGSLCLFVLAEALGLTPAALKQAGPMDVPWKYLVLVGLLAAPVVVEKFMKWSAQKGEAQEMTGKPVIGEVRG
jgi:urea transport system permease protein